MIVTFSALERAQFQALLLTVLRKKEKRIGHPSRLPFVFREKPRTRSKGDYCRKYSVSYKLSAYLEASLTFPWGYQCQKQLGVGLRSPTSDSVSSRKDSHRTHTWPWISVSDTRARSPCSQTGPRAARILLRHSESTLIIPITVAEKVERK